LADALGGVVSTLEAPSVEGNDVEPVRNPYYERATPSLGSGKSPAASLYSNLASVHVLRGDMEQAHAFVNQALSLDPTCRTALTALVYLNLREGRVAVALDVIKKQRMSEKLAQ
jgi:Tfp pilus assembly protein PilF